MNLRPTCTNNTSTISENHVNVYLTITTQVRLYATSIILNKPLQICRPTVKVQSDPLNSSENYWKFCDEVRGVTKRLIPHWC